MPQLSDRSYQAYRPVVQTGFVSGNHRFTGRSAGRGPTNEMMTEKSRALKSADCAQLLKSRPSGRGLSGGSFFTKHKHAGVRIVSGRTPSRSFQ